MKMLTVHCFRQYHDEDDEPRVAITIATDEIEAQAICRNAYRDEGFTTFKAAALVQESFAGPARLIGFTGQRPAFSWLP
jgi:hypothetical protein